MQYGPFYPSSVTGWTNPGNAAGAPDGNSASFVTPPLTEETGLLVATEFNAQVPTDKTVKLCRFVFTMTRPFGSNDSTIQVVPGPVEASATVGPGTYDYDNEEQGNHFSAADVNAASFGFQFAGYGHGTWTVDSIALYVEAD